MDSIQDEIIHILRQKCLSIATAESCTGGMLSARLTAVAGASEVFGYGVCTYANEAKERLAGVHNTTLAQFGAVSEQTACEMAQGIRELASADIGVGITGIAGPDGGTPEKPVGLVYIGIAFNGNTQVHKLLHINSSREQVREQAVRVALECVKLLLCDK